MSEDHEKQEKHEHKKKEVKSVTIKLTKTNLIIGGLVLALLLSVFTGGFGFGSSGGAVIVDSGSQPSAPARLDVSVDDDAVKGDPDAPVTIIEFSDYECPFCARFYTQTLPSIQEEYIDTGKAKLVYRDLPLPFHANAGPAAEAAECVRAQGGDDAYFEMHDAMFESGDLSESSLVSLASGLGYDIQSCLDDETFKDEVQADYRDAQAAGASGTPTFFIGNDDDGYIKLVGAQPFAVFQQAIEAELA